METKRSLRSKIAALESENSDLRHAVKSLNVQVKEINKQLGVAVDARDKERARADALAEEVRPSLEKKPIVIGSVVTYCGERWRVLEIDKSVAKMAALFSEFTFMPFTVRAHVSLLKHAL